MNWASYPAAGDIKDARHFIVKPWDASAPSGEIAILVAYAPSGRLKPHVLPYMQKLAETRLEVLLVVIIEQPLLLRDEEVAVAAGIIVRENAGYDFGAWVQALMIYPALLDSKLLIVANDSVVPTADSHVFASMMARVRASDADVVGLTENHEFGWHLQSYFLALKSTALRSTGFQRFLRNFRRIDDKNGVIRMYEVPFAPNMRKAGLTVEAMYAGSSGSNPTFFHWRELVEQGFPFIKILMLRDDFDVPSEQQAVLDDLRATWPTVLGQAGFDVDLIHAALGASQRRQTRAGEMGGLLVHLPEVGDASGGAP